MGESLGCYSQVKGIIKHIVLFREKNFDSCGNRQLDGETDDDISNL